MRVGVGAFKAPFFGSVVDKNKGSARVGFAQGVHFFDFQSGFGDGVYEHEIKLPGVFGYAVGHVQARVRGFQATHFLLKCVAEPLLDGAVQHFAVMYGQAPPRPTPPFFRLLFKFLQQERKRLKLPDFCP